MGYYLFHNGSANHSSEERIRGICRVLSEPPEIYSAGMEEDWHYGLGEIGGLHRNSEGCFPLGSWCITACPFRVQEFNRSGARSVLWGWVPGPQTLSREQIQNLRRFYRVIVPDEKNLELLRTVGIRKSLRLGPDPAFLVNRHIRPLDGVFRVDTVGLCVSPSVNRFERSQGLLYHSYCHLIKWILRNTNWQIALIPYSVKTGCNDRLLHMALRQRFEGEPRLICREDGDCRELRGDLSLCRCCVGTAGVLAGWSCGVPGLCIGTSGRARWMARMLFGSEQETLVSAGALKTEDELTLRFVDFLKREDALRGWLEVSLPRYRQWARQWQWCG